MSTSLDAFLIGAILCCIVAVFLGPHPEPRLSHIATDLRPAAF